MSPSARAFPCPCSYLDCLHDRFDSESGRVSHGALLRVMFGQFIAAALDDQSHHIDGDGFARRHIECSCDGPCLPA